MTINAQELGQRLQKARVACGITQADAAKHLEVARSTITQIELGNRTVSSLELDRLAYLFGRDIREFLADSFREDDTLAALFRAEPSVAEDPAVVEKIRNCISIGRELTNLEQLLEIDREQSALAGYACTTPKNRWEAIQQGERVADDERRRLGLSFSPVPDLAELIEQQGVRSGLVDFPMDVSGISINNSKLGLFVVVNSKHHTWRRRFSFAHEYGHLLMDRDRLSTVSKASKRNDLIEMRANNFAACFLMPTDGVKRFVSTLGKGKSSRTLVKVYDEHEVMTVEGRVTPHSQDLQLHDIVQIARHFGVSILAALFRLRNLRFITSTELDRLKKEDTSGRSRQIAKLLGLSKLDHSHDRNEFRCRFLGLGLEAYRREIISMGKLREVAKLVGAPLNDLEALIETEEALDKGGS